MVQKKQKTIVASSKQWLNAVQLSACLKSHFTCGGVITR